MLVLTNIIADEHRLVNTYYIYVIQQAAIMLTPSGQYIRVSGILNHIRKGVMSVKLKILIIIVILVACGLYLYRYMTRPPSEDVFRTTGTVEALETSIASKVAGRLTSVNFREGEKVATGDVLATIDQAEYVAAKKQAEAGVASAMSSLASGHDAVDTARARLAAAKADVARAEAQVASAQARLAQSDKDLARANELYAKGVIAKSGQDIAGTAQSTAKAELDAAKAASSASGSLTDAAYASLKEAEGGIAKLKAGVAAAEAALAAADSRLSDTTITSPVDAVVEYRTLEPGEVVAPGTSILTLADPANTWVRFDLDERMIGKVKTGGDADVSVEYLPGKKFPAKIFDIGREGEFAVERDVTRGRQDIRAFRTRARVYDPEGVLKPGMTVTVSIPIDKSAE